MVYKTWLGRALQSVFPVAGMVGLAPHLLAMGDFSLPARVSILTAFTASLFLASRGLTSGVVVKLQRIEYRGLLRTVRIRLDDFAEIRVGEEVVPMFWGPLYAGSARGVVLVRRDGTEVACPAIYGYGKVDEVARRIRCDVRRRKHEALK